MTPRRPLSDGGENRDREAVGTLTENSCHRWHVRPLSREAGQDALVFGGCILFFFKPDGAKARQKLVTISLGRAWTACSVRVHKRGNGYLSFDGGTRVAHRIQGSRKKVTRNTLAADGLSL